MTPVAPHRSTPDNHRRGRERAWIATAVLVTVPLIPLVPSTAQEARADTVDEQARLADLVEDIDAILDDPALEDATSGVVVLDPDTGEALYSQEADTQLLPASNMKMFSGAAALEVLGTEHTFATEVVAEAAPGHLRAVDDLYLVGGGDPALTAEDIDSLAAEVADSGVRVVTDVYADDTWFDDERLVDDWWPEDEPFAYSAQISALTVAHGDRFDTGVTEVVVEPTSEGEPVEVDPGVAEGYVELDNQAVTGTPGSDDTLVVDRPTGTNTIEVSGSLPADAEPVEELRTVDEPAGLAGHLFARALEEHGVKVRGDVELGGVPDQWQGVEVLADHTSPELAEIMVPFMKFSNNAHAEILVKSIGQEVADEGSWEAGLTGVEETLTQLGVDTDDLVLNDGSGLSRGNWVTASTVADLLVQTRDTAWAEEFRVSLPVAGDSDPFVGGTLAGRMVGTAAEGVVQAKTGTMTGVSALSGHVSAPDGGGLVFSVVNNDHVGPAPTEVQDAIVVRLAEYLGHGVSGDTFAQRALPEGSGELECSWERVC